MKNSTMTPTSPPLSELSWRAITPDDLPALVDLAEECRQVDGGLAIMTKPDILWRRYFPEGRGVSTGAFAVDGHLAACSTMHVLTSPGAERAAIAGQVRPAWRSKGIGNYLLRWSEAQASALLTPETTDRQVLRIATESLTESADRLYRGHRFEQVFQELVMRRDLRLPLPDFPMPRDVALATWRPELATQFYQAYYASFRDRPGFTGESAEEWIGENAEDEDFKPEWSLLALSGQAPVGFLTAATDNRDGFIVQFGVIPEQRRLGLGSALVVESMRRMSADGATAVQLDVNINNPGAILSYQKLGFVTVGRRARYERVEI